MAASVYHGNSFGCQIIRASNKPTSEKELNHAQETTTKRPGRARKYIRRALLALAAVILAAVLVLLALFQAELRTLNTIERVDNTDLFTMTYLGARPGRLLAQGGASNDNELLDFLMQKLLKGLPLRFDIPDLAAPPLPPRPRRATPSSAATLTCTTPPPSLSALPRRTATAPSPWLTCPTSALGRTSCPPACWTACSPGRPLCPSGRPEREGPGGGSAAPSTPSPPTSRPTSPTSPPPPPSACCWIGRPPWMRRWHC